MVNVRELVNFVQQEIRLAMQQEKSLKSGIDRAAVAEVRTNRIIEFIETSRAPKLTEISKEDIDRISKELVDKTTPTPKFKPELYISMRDLDEDDKPRLETKCDQCGASISACNAQSQARRHAEAFYRQEGIPGLEARTKADKEYPDLRSIKPNEEKVEG